MLFVQGSLSFSIIYLTFYFNSSANSLDIFMVIWISYIQVIYLRDDTSKVLTFEFKLLKSTKLLSDNVDNY